jgi:outer membrane protein assembly factor BamB
MSELDPETAQRFREAMSHLVFVGFNSRVAAINRNSGETLWEWKSSKGTSEYVALLVDDERLVVSVQGYTYCLNPLTGEELWFNPMKGFGYGIPSLASINGSSNGGTAADVIQRRKAANQAHASDTTAGS